MKGPFENTQLTFISYYPAVSYIKLRLLEEIASIASPFGKFRTLKSISTVIYHPQYVHMAREERYWELEAI